jgi:hypothetical protein
MKTDIALVMGTILGALALVAVLTALIEGRRPRVAALVVVISGGLILWGAGASADGFQWDDIPNAFISVAAAILN